MVVQDVVEDKRCDVVEADYLIWYAAYQSALDDTMGIELIDERVGCTDNIEVEIPDIHGVVALRLLTVFIHIMAMEGFREAVGGPTLLLDVMDIGEAVAQGGATDEGILTISLLKISEGRVDTEGLHVIQAAELSGILTPDGEGVDGVLGAHEILTAQGSIADGPCLTGRTEVIESLALTETPVVSWNQEGTLFAHSLLELIQQDVRIELFAMFLTL